VGPHTPHLSNSMAKSVTSLAVGFAESEGRIRSLDDAVRAYVPELDGHAYGDTSIRNLLRMASGIPFSERYDGADDHARFTRDAATSGVVAAASRMGRRTVPQGSLFNYASIESHVLSAVVRGAAGQGLSGYLASRLWQPMGAEGDAWWRTDVRGLEKGGGFLSATPVDWMRLGVLLAHDGQRPDTGRPILPRGYLDRAADSRRVDRPFQPGIAGPYGYGYPFWLMPGVRRQFALIGVFGQALYVDTQAKLAMLHLAINATPRADGTTMGRERDALWRGGVSSLS
jgi:CubicO group peptidase (beta-lactamase class C family)